MNSTSMTYRNDQQPVVSAKTQDVVQARMEPADARSNDTTSGRNVRWLSYVDKRLEALSNRPAVLDDPDDYPKPPPDTITTARAIAWENFGSGTPTPNVVPAAQGGVDFVWYKGDWHLKISVDTEGAWVWAHNLSTGDLWKGSLGENLERLRKLLVELAGVP
jgi:hypothetical protein